MEFKEITLTQGKVAIVDAEDFERLNQYKWYYVKATETLGYASRKLPKQGLLPRRAQRLHWEVIGYKWVDHINGDGLDNRKINLRPATVGQNNCNQGVRKDNTSGFKGVYFHKRCKKFGAQIDANRKRYHLGLFNTAEAAHEAYVEAAKRLHGGYAKWK